MLETVGVSVCMNKIVEMKQHVTFCSEFSILCIKDIELLLTVLSNFEKEMVYKDSAF